MARSYLIPDNFIDGGKVFGGTFKTRNFVEAIVLCGALVLISLQIPCNSFQVRISLTIFMGAPGLILGLIGVNNDPLSVFLVNVLKWYRSRKTMLFNEAVQCRNNDIVAKMMEQQSPQEVLAKQLKAMQDRNQSEDYQMVEGVDFHFEADPELSKYTSPKKERRSTAPKKTPAAQLESVDTVIDIQDLIKQYSENAGAVSTVNPNNREV